MKISIIIPVYNGADTIAKLVERLFEVLSAINLEIILVNDASLDNSHNVCRELQKKYNRKISYLNLARNFGEHSAVMAGLNYATGDYMLILDDDFQNPPEEVLKLINAAEKNDYDIVYSYYKTKKHGWFRNLGSKFTNYIAGILLEKPHGLYLSSFKCLSRFVVEEIKKYNGPYPYIDGLALRCTRNIGRVLVRHDRRVVGKSGYTIRKLFHLWLNMFVNFSVIPLRVSSLLGLIFSCAGVFLIIGVVIEKTHNPDLPLGWASMIIVIILFSGIQLFMLGLLGEYLGRLFLSNNNTPQFVVRDIYQRDSGDDT